MIKAEYYEEAVLRIATFEPKDGLPLLVFATVTLLAPGRVTLIPDETVDYTLSEHTGVMHFRRARLAAWAAIDWYRGLKEGRNNCPPSATNEEASSHQLEFHLSSLEDSPIWPSAGLPMGDSFFSTPHEIDDPAPFLGNIPARVHRRFGCNDGLDSIRGDAGAMLALARRLHIDLRAYDEYLGSVALVAPDPLIQRVENFMLPATEGEGERIFYRFIPRAGQSLAGLRITTFDEDMKLLTSFESRPVPDDGILIIDKGMCAGTYGYVVTHPDHGVLLYSPPATFIRQANINISVVQRELNVNVPMSDAQNAPQMSYRTQQRSNISSGTFGEAPLRLDARAAIRMSSERRRRISQATKAGQRWFSNGSREDAMRFLQAEIGRAKSRIIVADPYFGWLQLPQFLYAIGDKQVSLTLLMSALAFKEKEPSTRKHRLAQFERSLADLRAATDVAADVVVLNPSVLHDRFLVVDSNVWFMGNSLNSLGDKASVIVKLPDPDDVIARLRSMIEGGRTFQAYSDELFRADDISRS